MCISRSPLPQNNGKLNFTPFWYKLTNFSPREFLLIIIYIYELVHLDNIFMSVAYMLYKKMGVTRILQLCQCNGKELLP